MKTAKFTLLILAMALLGSCKKGGVFCYKENGNITTENRALDNFTEIEMGTQANVYITQGDYKVEVETSDNLQDIITTKVKGNKLIIETKKGKCIKGNPTINVYVSAPEIRSLVLSGSGNVFAKNLITSSTMDLTLSGSGNIEVDSLDADNLDIVLSGSGNVIAQGVDTGNHQYTSISGSGNVTTLNYMVNEADVKISGSGSCTVYPINHLDATISGSGDILYLGTPTVSTNISGSGDVRPY